MLRPTAPHDAGLGLRVVRLVVACVLGVHPLHGLWSGGHPGVNITHGFGAYLTGEGLPFGPALAWGVILLQAAAVLALLAGRWVVPACGALIGVLAVGVGMIHAHAGWFVVGDGRNGAEFSVLLMGCLAGVAAAYWRGGMTAAAVVPSRTS